jgi:hypothetical protein
MSERQYYTLDEANAMVPWLEQCFARILQLRSQMRGLYSTLESLGQRPDPDSLLRSSGSDAADGLDVVRARSTFVGLMELMQEELLAIQNEGVEVKDLDTGLCDFWSTSVVPGVEVYLCWRYGEKRITHYHEPHTGFAGRKPVPPPAPSG